MTDIRELTFWQTIREFPNRVVTLIWKLCSIKGLALAISTYLIRQETITGWEAVVLFLTTVLMVVGGREAEKWKGYFIEMKK